SIARLAAVGLALLVTTSAASSVVKHDAAQAAVLDQGVGNFDGPWYFGGDLSRPILIIQAGTNLVLMNEQGRVANATANINQIAANWGDGPITGTLAPDQRQINWDNGTFWQRQAQIDTASLGGAPNVSGIWYVDDTSTQRALIVQPAGGQLQLM